jgi:hypothetical protein
MGTLVVSDGDVVGLWGGLVQSRDVQDTVSINVKGNFNLREHEEQEECQTVQTCRASCCPWCEHALLRTLE